MSNDVPVLIVGGGGAGLTCSMLLSQLGIKTLLVSSLPTTSILPKAHVLNQRTMEILAVLCRLAQADFARALMAAADVPAAPKLMFDVFNARVRPDGRSADNRVRFSS